MLLDPATKNFSDWLLGPDLSLKTRNLLKNHHREAYTALNKESVPQVNAELEVLEEDQDDPVENEPNALNLEDDEDLEAEFGGTDEAFDGPSIVLDPEQLDGEVDLIAEADGIFEQWMEFTPKFGDYLIEGSKPLLSNKTTGKVSFREIVSKFDTRGYFRTHGLAEYPSITLLARVHFSTMFNGGFQERVFLRARL